MWPTARRTRYVDGFRLGQDPSPERYELNEKVCKRDGLTIGAASRCKPRAWAVRTAAPSWLQHSVIRRSKVKKRALWEWIDMKYEENEELINLLISELEQCLVNRAE
jgi:hypothetical protein